MFPWTGFKPRRLCAAWLVLLGWCILALLALSPAVAGMPSAQYLVRQADIEFQVVDAGRMIVELETLAQVARGRFVGKVQVFVATDGQRRVEATLELPPEMLDTALARLRGMALTVLDENVEQRDVSSEIALLNQQLEQLRARRRQLRDLLERADGESERRQVETALEGVEAEIADAEAALNSLQQDVDWAVIRIVAHEAPATATPPPTLTATPLPITPSPTPWRPGETVAAATGVLGAIARALGDVLIVGAIIGGPLIVGILIGWWIRRRF